MRLPAVAIAAAFAGGIALGLSSSMAKNSDSLIFLKILLGCALLLILAGFLLVRLHKLFFAGYISLIAWGILGTAGALIGQQPRSSHHVISLVESNQIDLKSPLLWHGILRDEPARLSWGLGYEMSLSSVEINGELVPCEGGLRVSFTTHPDQPLPMEVHAGDSVSVFTQAKRPQVFKDEGAFDRREYLAQQNVDLVATLRAPQLLDRESVSIKSASAALARQRAKLRGEIDQLFLQKPEVAGVLRAMLLGDRSFVDRDEAVDFQKTGVFHVLVVAGLHVGAIAFALFWLGRRLRLSSGSTIFFTLALLLMYVAVVEQRPPVLRATLMVVLVVLGKFFFRRLELLNSAAMAALFLLIAKPLALRDSSFQLTFLAIGSIAGIALPFLARTLQPYATALRGWRDVTRDASLEARAAQFRIDLRSVVRWIFSHFSVRAQKTAENSFVNGLSIAFWVWELFVLTIILQMGMLPLMARDFHRITLSAPFVNLLAVPLTGVLVSLGFVVLVIGAVFPALGRFLAIPLGWLTSVLLHVVHWFSQLAGWSYRIPGPYFWVEFIFFAIVILLAVLLRMRNKKWKWICLACFGMWLVTVLIVAVFPFSPQWDKGKLTVTILDVGQGDSIFAVSPGGRTLLIDGGGAFGGFPGHEEHNGVDPGEEAVSPYLWSLGFKKIDVVALTHAHQDHIGGLSAVLQNFHVGELWIGREVSGAVLKKLETLATKKKIAISHELRGQKFNWEGAQGEFLWPENLADDTAASPKNNDSLVLKLHFGNRTVLLPGDAEKQAERQILAENNEDALHADVLKIGHHGSKNSTMPEFLATVHPSIAVISAGEDNPYGHPSPELLERLQNANIRILRTDRDGSVHILTDGKKIEVTCFVACLEKTAEKELTEPQTPNAQQNQQ